MYTHRKYCTLQIIQGGKVLRFLWIDQYPQKFTSETACAMRFDYARLPSNHECFPANYNNWETFPPRIICNIQIVICMLLICINGECIIRKSKS